MTVVRLGTWRGLTLTAPAGDRPEDEFARREAAVDAVVAASEVDVTPAAVRARAREMWEATCAELRAGGTSPSAYLRLTGKSRDEVLREAEPQAREALAREAVLTAIADEAGIPAGGDPEERMVAAVDAVLAQARLGGS